MGQKDKLKLLEDLCHKVKLTEKDWQRLAPFLLPEEMRRKFLRYPWSLEDRRNLGLLIKVPICLQDPSFIRDPNSKLRTEEIEVSWEPDTTDGPTSARIAVEDRFEAFTPDPAKWDARGNRFVDAQGRPIAPRLNITQFHQINVWAIAQRILEFYEDITVLGRPVQWGFNGNRLIIRPHAATGITDTAYNPKSRSLEFSYIDDVDHRVFACLSHDIVAHETGHAVLDGIRPYFYDSWTLETVAFHEFVADLTALLSSLRNNSVRKIFIEYLEKDLPEKDFLAKIGEEFGKAISGFDFLRSAKNKVTMEDVHRLKNDSPDIAAHDSSQVLTGLIYDLLLKLYEGYRQRKSTSGKHFTPDQASWHMVSGITQMALQPLDFLPPVDVAFSDYIEAFLIRDQLLYPEDKHGYRQIFQKLCRERKIDDPLADKPPRKPHDLSNPQVEGLLASRTSAYKYIHANREALRIPAKRDIVVDVYAAQKVDRTFFRLPREIIVQYIWKEDVHLEGKEFENLKTEEEIEEVPLLCGGTLVFDESGNFRYWVDKRGTEFKNRKETEEQPEGERRKKDLIAYCRRCVAKEDKDAIKELFLGRFITRL